MQPLVPPVESNFTKSEFAPTTVDDGYRLNKKQTEGKITKFRSHIVPSPEGAPDFNPFIQEESKHDIMDQSIMIKKQIYNTHLRKKLDPYLAESGKKIRR